jgi:hypothetical protein
MIHFDLSSVFDEKKKDDLFLTVKDVALSYLMKTEGTIEKQFMTGERIILLN